MLKNYFNIAVRNLWRNKIFSFINITGLSVGLACCMLIFLYSKDEVSYDRFHKKANTIYRIVVDQINADGSPGRKMGITGMFPGPTFKRAIPEIEDFVRLQKTSFTVRRGNEVFDQQAYYADESFFSVFSFPLIAGSPKKALSDLHSIVLSEDLAEKYFGKTNAVGQILELNVGGKFENFTVSGVAKKSPQNSSIKFKMLVPMKFYESKGESFNWVWFSLNTFVVLHPDANIKSVETKFAAVYKKEAGEFVEKVRKEHGMKETFLYGLQPLLSIHLSKDYPTDELADGSSPVYSYILSGIAIFILLIACINFVNLTVARSLKRAKEIGIRKVVGGQRQQLIAQFLGESFILCLGAFLLAILIVQVILPFFNTVSNKALSFSYLLDTKLVVGYIALFILTGLLAGFYPALVLSGFNPVKTLYGRVQFSGKNYLSKSLVVLQFTLATFLIIATIIIYSQFNYLLHKDLGYNDKNLAVIYPGDMDQHRANLFKNELSVNSSIKSIALRFNDNWETRAKANEKDIITDVEIIDENYLPIFQIPLVKGRNFSTDFPSDSTQSVLINETFAKEAGWNDAVSKKLDFNGSQEQNKHYTVIGVVKDYHFQSLTEKISPQIFAMGGTSLSNYGQIWMKLKPSNTAQTLNFIGNTFKKLLPFQPYQYNFKDAMNEEQYNKEAKWRQIITFAAILTIFISCIGLFGLATLSAERRVKEIGIRKVLGASVSAIVRMLSSDFLKLVIIAALIASPAAWWAMNKWLENYPYRIEMNSWIFGFAAILVMLIALFTMSFQAIRAAVANPVRSLRTE